MPKLKNKNIQLLVVDKSIGFWEPEIDFCLVDIALVEREIDSIDSNLIESAYFSYTFSPWYNDGFVRPEEVQSKIIDILVHKHIQVNEEVSVWGQYEEKRLIRKDKIT